MMGDLQISAGSRARLKRRFVVASLSGGKDSTALALLLAELEIPHVRVFADTGFEAPETYEYLDVLRARLGPISVVRNEAFWKDALPGEEGMLTLIRCAVAGRCGGRMKPRNASTPRSILS